LLRKAVNLIDEALRKASQPPASQRHQVPVATSHHTPVQAEVARLFAPYTGATQRNLMRRSSLTQISRRSYTHTFCCLAEHNADKVPSVVLKPELLASGLGEQKVTFSG
ncbi:hypothetical protein ATANTOWER_024613, partial [Ataeniobius toweri]|nr:hypothetical protein [Ataeniobius toweri]